MEPTKQEKQAQHAKQKQHAKQDMHDKRHHETKHNQHAIKQNNMHDTTNLNVAKLKGGRRGGKAELKYLIDNSELNAIFMEQSLWQPSPPCDIMEL